MKRLNKLIKFLDNKNNWTEEALKNEYFDYCKYLQEKYGNVPYPYFTTEKFKSKNNKNKHKELKHLEIHHIYELEQIGLSNLQCARNYPWWYQLPENLVYVDYFEHVVIHILIYLHWCITKSNRINITINNYIIGKIISITTTDRWKDTQPIKVDLLKAYNGIENARKMLINILKLALKMVRIKSVFNFWAPRNSILFMLLLELEENDCMNLKEYFENKCNQINWKYDKTKSFLENEALFIKKRLSLPIFNLNSKVKSAFNAINVKINNGKTTNLWKNL